jgi:hypothetical protein
MKSPNIQAGEKLNRELPIIQGNKQVRATAELEFEDARTPGLVKKIASATGTSQKRVLGLLVSKALEIPSVREIFPEIFKERKYEWLCAGTRSKKIAQRKSVLCVLFNPKTRKIIAEFEMPVSLWEAVVSTAAERGRSIGGLIADAMRRKLQRDGISIPSASR